MNGKVYIIGAGPGSPDLLTIKAAKCLAEANILFYDHLVGSDILKLVNPSCELVFVGKKNQHHHVNQNETCKLLFEATSKHKSVVRLKGGDPFIFGRGGEEAIYLNERNVSFEVVPGISSSIAAPAYAGIPVTHRNISRSVTIVTGHQAKGKAQIDWSRYAQLETLVILMGVYKRVEIAQDLINAGRAKSKPVAFIEEATTERQNIIITTLGEVALGKVDVKSPAVTVIGEVVSLQEQISWYENTFVNKENHFTEVNENPQNTVVS